MQWLYIFASTYALSLCSDFLKTLVEIWINFRREPRMMRLGLGPKSACFIIPCHNSSDVIYDTIMSLPKEYTVYCMVNACSDSTLQRIGFLAATLNDRIIKYEHIVEPGKMNAVMHGVVKAREAGFTHFVLLDDDVRWPKGHIPRVAKNTIPATGLPVLPMQPVWSTIEVGQCIEYMYMVVSKRAQGILGNTIMASGAAGIYRVDTFLEVLKHHYGEHIGDDLQSAHIHHSLGMQIDFNPDIVIQTHPPRSLVDWWKQRAKRWEISPIYNLKWILTTIFGRVTKGWWIRWIASYRIFVGVNDLARVISFTYVVQHFPRTLVGVWLIAYVCFCMHRQSKTGSYLLAVLSAV